MKLIKIFLLTAALSLPRLAAAQAALYGNEFPLGDVKLLDSPFKSAMELNVDVLLSYDTDRLLAPFFIEAGLEPKGELFPNWAGLDGHVGGHYLTALAIHYASTGDGRIRERMDYMLSQLALCAAARNDGYIGGVPKGDLLWEEIRKGNVGKVWDYWVPWYNVHKIYAGLRDTWVYAGSKAGLNLFLNLCDWGIGVTANLTDGQMEQMLGNEFGGMNEVYADAYAITGDKKYLDAARRFTHHAIYDDLVAGEDRLDNLHANTQVPKIVGFQRVAEVTGDRDYEKAAEFFWNTVVGHRSLSIGGNSRREHFPSAADAKSYVDDREGPESCNTNNMLKLTEGLFRMNPDARYADYYERALYNHILSTQHPEHGGYVYFTSARPGHYRVYSQPNSAMWCCVGTGMENHGKYGQFIYAHAADTLWVNLFIPSELDWKDKGIRVTQQNRFPQEPSTRLTVNVGSPSAFALNLRHPGWCDKPVVKVNGEIVKVRSTPSSYITLSREWHDGDVVEMQLPMQFRIEELNYLPNYVSIVRGPIVLGARLDTDVPMPGLIAGDHRWGHIAGGPLVSVFDTPLLIGNRKDLVRKLNSLKPAADNPLRFDAGELFENCDGDVVLEPFAGIHDSRYILYWLSMSPGDYAGYQKKARQDEATRLALDKRTVDAVNTGEQQPEADHRMRSERTSSGNYNGEPWRDASNGGYFSYEMSTGGSTDLMLRVRYWGNEQGMVSGKIFIDDVALQDIASTGRRGSNEFVDVEYMIPADLLRGKQSVNVKFASDPKSSTGGIYHVRLLTR